MILPRFFLKSELAKFCKLSKASWGISLSHWSLPLPSSQIFLNSFLDSIQFTKVSFNLRLSVGVETKITRKRLKYRSKHVLHDQNSHEAGDQTKRTSTSNDFSKISFTLTNTAMNRFGYRGVQINWHKIKFLLLCYAIPYISIAKHWRKIH